MIVLFHRNEKTSLRLMGHLQNWPLDVKKLKKSCQQFLETTNKFGRLKIFVPDISAHDWNPTKTFYTQNMTFKMYFKPRRQNPDFYQILFCLFLWKLATYKKLFWASKSAVYNRERFQIKSGLYWCTYSIYTFSIGSIRVGG